MIQAVREKADLIADNMYSKFYRAAKKILTKMVCMGEIAVCFYSCFIIQPFRIHPGIKQ